jgi:uncharacterized membrane protein
MFTIGFKILIVLFLVALYVFVNFFAAKKLVDFFSNK